MRGARLDAGLLFCLSKKVVRPCDSESMLDDCKLTRDKGYGLQLGLPLRSHLDEVVLPLLIFGRVSLLRGMTENLLDVVWFQCVEDIEKECPVKLPSLREIVWKVLLEENVVLNPWVDVLHGDLVVVGRIDRLHLAHLE